MSMHFLKQTCPTQTPNHCSTLPLVLELLFISVMLN